MKKIFWIVFGVVSLIGIGWGLNHLSRSNEDFRMAFINDKGIVIRSVSWQRKMVNELSIDGKVMIWIPNGMGWYRSDTIGKLLKQENKTDLAGKLFFYNLGFVPDVVIFGDDENWSFNWQIIKKWGIQNAFLYWSQGTKMMMKQDSISGDLLNQPEDLGETIQRDFADSRLLKEDMRLTVYNQSQSAGLAGFVSRALEWSGLTVVGEDNYSGEIPGKCLVSFGVKASGFMGFELLKKEFEECKYSENKDLGQNEVELYFGDKYSQMLNYQSYK